MAQSKFLPRTIETAANKGMSVFKGDAEVAEETGITFNPERARSQYESGRKVGELLARAATLPPVSLPETPAIRPPQIDPNQKGGLDASAYGALSEGEAARNIEGVQAIRDHLAQNPEQDK